MIVIIWEDVYMHRCRHVPSSGTGPAFPIIVKSLLFDDVHCQEFNVQEQKHKPKPVDLGMSYNRPPPLS